MRSRLSTLAVLGFIMVAPVAAALSGLPLPAGRPDAPEEENGEVHDVADAVGEATGMAPAPDALPPLVAPVEGVSGTLPLLGLVGLGALGLAGLASFAFFHGGARFVTPAEVLQNDVRQRIYAHLKQRVGANLKQVTDDLHLTTTNAIWHLRKLEEAGLIHSRRFNGYKVFYPAEGGIEARRLTLGKTALANGNAQEVFEHVVAHPGSHQREIARALGVNHGTVRWHLKKLMHAELIVETRRGKASSYAPTEIGMAALREVQPRAAPQPAAAPLVTAA